MGNGINKVFVNLGVALIILGLVAAGMQMRGVKLPFVGNQILESPAPSTEPESEAEKTAPQIKSRVKKVVDTQSSSGHDEWVKVSTKTCEIAWNNKDFKDGWCKLGTAQPGTFKFEIRSSLKSTSLDNKTVSYPSDGLPIKQLQNNGENFDYIDHFETWSPIKNHRIGSIMLKIDNESPIDSREITLTKMQPIYASINFPFSEDNWLKMNFNGSITIDVLKMKSE